MNKTVFPKGEFPRTGSKPKLVKPAVQMPTADEVVFYMTEVGSW